MNGFMIIAIISIVLFYYLVLKPYTKSKNEEMDNFSEEFKKSLKITAIENSLIESNVIPTDEHINLYYRMYLKKWELDYKDQWITDKIHPMLFDDFQKKAKDNYDGGGYRYIIASTMDMFMGFPPNLRMSRYRNYHEMVMTKEELEKFLSIIENEKVENNA